MATALADNDLDAWRARRTGKPVKTDNSGGPEGVPTNAGGNPMDIRIARHPLEDMTPPGLANDPAPAPADPAPQPNGQSDALVEELRQQLAAANGRNGPVQRQFEEMKTTLSALQQQNALLQQQLESRTAEEAESRRKKAASDFNPFDGIPQEQLDMLDPTALKLMEHIGRNVYAKTTHGSVDPVAVFHEELSKRDARTKDDYIMATAETLGIPVLAKDPKFSDFLAEDDSAGMLLNSFMQSKDLATARLLETNLRKMLKRYEKTASATRTPDPQASAATHLNRAPSGQQGGQGNTPSNESVTQITVRAKALARAGKHKEAKALLDSINQ
jgi:hypothetical protein